MTDQNVTPETPNDVDFLLLAEPSPDAEWALYEVQDPAGNLTGIDEAPRELAALLSSARRYPPALAMAREELSHRMRENSSSKVEFSAQLGARLRELLYGQATANFFLAESLEDELGYRTKGEFYWIVRISRDREHITWISDDYFLYEAPVEEFRLGPEARLRLPIAPD